MSTRILGKKYLNSESYDKISIEKNRVETIIKADSEGFVNNLDNKKVLEKLSNLSDDEQVEYVINSYLKNNTLNKIKYNQGLKSISDTNKILYFKSQDSYFDVPFIKQIYDRIFYKYSNDRILALNNNNTKRYEITTHEKLTEYKVENDTTTLTLATEQKILEGYEVEFLVDFLVYKIMKADNNVNLTTHKWNEFKMDIPCLELDLNGVIINFDKDNKDLKELVINILNNYENTDERRR